MHVLALSADLLRLLEFDYQPELKPVNAKLN
jgi:hypothetical protein